MSAPAKALTITINAETAEAAARVHEFFRAFADNAQKLTGMASFLEEFGKKIVGAFAIGSIVEFTRHAIEAEATLERMSRKSGITVGMLAALRSEARKNGLAFEELDAGMVMFSDRVFQAVRHGGQFAEVFRDLKIPLVEANGQLRPIDEILLEIARKFQAMPSGPQKAAMAMELFGRSGRQFISLLSANTDQLIAKMKEHGAEEERNAKLAEEFHRSVIELTQSFQSIWKQLGNDLLPALQHFVEHMKSGVDWLKTASKEGSTLNTVLKQTAMLLLAVAAAKAAASVTSLFGWAMTSAAGDFATALGLIIGRFKGLNVAALQALATSRVVAYASALAIANEVIQTGIELWRMYAAEKNKALTDEQVKAQDTDLQLSLMRAIDAQQKAGTISQKIADIYRSAVHDAFKTSPDAIALHDRLTNLMRSLRTHADGQQAEKTSDRPSIGPSDREIKLAEARLQSWLRSEASANAVSDATNEELYKKRQISVETYFAVKKRLLNQSSHDELTALQNQLRIVDQQRRDPQNASNKEKQDELSIKREEILSKLLETRAKLRVAMAKLAGEKWTEEQSRNKERQALEQGYAEMRLSHIRAEQALIQSNPNLTDVEKAKQLIPLLQKENAEIEAQIALELKRQKTKNLKPEGILESERKVEALRQQLAQLHQKQQETDDGLTFGGQFKSQFVGLRNSFGTVQQNIAKGWANMVQSMRDGLASGIDDMFWKWQGFSKAISNFGLAMLHSMTQSFAQIAANWIMQHTVMAAWSSIHHMIENAKAAASTATQVGIHTAGETAKTGATGAGVVGRGLLRAAETIYHGLQVAFRVVTHIGGEIAMTAASLAQSIIRRLGAFMEAQPYIFLAAVKAASAVADIPFVGPILAPIAAATTFAALEALAVFKEGGYTGDGDANSPAGIVHKGEFVFPKHVVAKLGLANLQMMVRSPGISAMPMMMNSVAQAPRGMNAPASGAGRGDVHVVIVSDHYEAKKYIDSTQGEAHLMRIVGRQIHRITRR